MRYARLIKIPIETDDKQWIVECWYGFLDTQVAESVMHHLPRQGPFPSREMAVEKAETAVRELLKQKGIGPDSRS
jgi:hypothetical protein